jgi:hypothetical protein
MSLHSSNSQISWKPIIQSSGKYCRVGNFIDIDTHEKIYTNQNVLK